MSAAAALAPGYETLDWRKLQPVIARILELADAQLVFMLLVVYVAVAMVVLNAMLMSVFERIHEFGVMKAIGVTPWQITALVFMETLVQVSAAGLLALGLLVIDGRALRLLQRRTGAAPPAAGGRTAGGATSSPGQRELVELVVRGAEPEVAVPRPPEHRPARMSNLRGQATATRVTSEARRAQPPAPSLRRGFLMPPPRGGIEKWSIDPV